MAQDVWTNTLYSHESYHWEECAPFGRSLLRGHAYSHGWLYILSLPSPLSCKKKYAY